MSDRAELQRLEREIEDIRRDIVRWQRALSKSHDHIRDCETQIRRLQSKMGVLQRKRDLAKISEAHPNA